MLSLLKRAQSEAELFVILGDLFEIWVGEGGAFQKEYAPLIEEFKRLKRTARILYFEGNHDFHLDGFWREKIGCEVETGPRLIEFQGMKIWAEHGDEINRNDTGYLFLRKVLRLSPVKFSLEHFPSSIILNVGAKASDTSRKYRKDPSNIIQIFRDYAVALRSRENFDLLLAGHSHSADDFSFNANGDSARIINLGSWFDGPHFLRIAGGRIEHVKI